MAREASTLSWRLAMPGFSGVVLIPLGRLQTFTIPLLARGPLLFHHLHPRTGDVRAPFISESIAAVAIGRQPCGYANAEKQLLGHPWEMPGVWGRSAFRRVLPRGEFMGRVTHRAAFGGTLTARELWLGIWLLRRFLFLLSCTASRVSGRFSSGASCPISSIAREASTLSLATRHAGFSRRGIDPVGETSNVNDPPLGSRPFVVSPPASANWRHPCSSYK